VSSKYIQYCFISPFVKNQILKTANSAVVGTYTITNAKKTQIPLPPFPQQQKIANILDAADALRQNNKALIAKYDELTQALFLDMFGDPVSNPKGWDKFELKKLGKVITGSTPPSSKENMFGGNIPFVTPGDLDKTQPYKRFVTKEGALNSRTVEKGSLFVCCIGTIGKTGIARELSTFNQQINAVKWCNNINFQFGFNCFASLKKELIEKAISTTLPIMKKSEFEKLKMICPPIELQNQFAERVEVIEEQKAIAQRQLEKSEELFNSLLQKAFKGQLTN
jgi:type I restriction enzyme S subunit